MVNWYLIPLLVLTSGLAWFDIKFKRVPNTVTHMLLFVGLSMNLPGKPVLWMISLLVLLGWHMGMMGGGDAKLWLAVFWISPSNIHMSLPLAFGTVVLFSGLAQLVWRAWLKKPLINVSTPGAWRVIPLLAWLALVG